MDLEGTLKLDARSLAAAAACGLIMATACEKKDDAQDSASVGVTVAASGTAAKKDKQCCMGLNACKGQGGCAVPEGNDCAGKNECKGKGGCNMHCPKK